MTKVIVEKIERKKIINRYGNKHRLRFYALAQHVISQGAVSIAVAGQLPIGCTPLFLTIYESQNKHDYDEEGCLKKINYLALYHNTLLKKSLKQLHCKYPQVKIVYADYYEPVLELVKSSEHYGNNYFLLHD